MTDKFQPKSTVAKFFDAIYRIFILVPVFTWQEWRCKKARQYLLTHDYNWRDTYVGNKLVAERNALYGKGVRPDDERIPDRWDVALALPPMAWPHADLLEFLKKDHTKDQKPR